MKHDSRLLAFALGDVWLIWLAQGAARAVVAVSCGSARDLRASRQAVDKQGCCSPLVY